MPNTYLCLFGLLTFSTPIKNYIARTYPLTPKKLEISPNLWKARNSYIARTYALTLEKLGISATASCGYSIMNRLFKGLGVQLTFICHPEAGIQGTSTSSKMMWVRGSCSRHCGCPWMSSAQNVFRDPDEVKWLNLRGQSIRLAN